ncbi:DUF5753 domain-containing protein [Plantactinospora sp. WMMB782]|uniref:DUF5753 domain-containing protein n=1 Tax=Plantactinospora sp. WMMB782 TaxID=3404121 RepID=UPI003B957604
MPAPAGAPIPKAKGWWHAYGGAIAPFFELYVGLESAAERIRSYEAELIPGLLQTEEYTREVVRVFGVHRSAEEREQRVAIKLERQHLLRRRLPPPPDLRVILNEAALRRPLAEAKAMAQQLHHLVNVSTELPNVSVRVLPFSAGLHPAGAGAFLIFDFDEGRTHPEPSTVYSEGATGAIYLDKPSELVTYERIWAGLDEAALDAGQSHRLITAIAEEYES